MRIKPHTDDCYAQRCCSVVIEVSLLKDSLLAVPGFAGHEAAKAGGHNDVEGFHFVNLQTGMPCEGTADMSAT